MPCHNLLLALRITAEMYSSLSVNKIELKIKIAGISAIQVTSMGSSPTYLLLAAAHGVGVLWLACACCLAIRVCHLFAVFKCLQTRSNPGSTSSALQQVLAVVQSGTGSCLGSGYCSNAEHCPNSSRWCLWQCRLQLKARLQASPPAVAYSGDGVKVLPAFPGIHCCWCWNRVDERPRRAHISYLNISREPCRWLRLLPLPWLPR